MVAFTLVRDDGQDSCVDRDELGVRLPACTSLDISEVDRSPKKTGAMCVNFKGRPVAVAAAADRVGKCHKVLSRTNRTHD